MPAGGICVLPAQELLLLERAIRADSAGAGGGTAALQMLAKLRSRGMAAPVSSADGAPSNVRVAHAGIPRYLGFSQPELDFGIVTTDEVKVRRSIMRAAASAPPSLLYSHPSLHHVLRIAPCHARGRRL